MVLGPASAACLVAGTAHGLRAPVLLAARWLAGSTPPRTTGHQREKKRQQATGTWRGLFGRAGCPGTDLTGPPPPKLEDGIGVLMNNIPGSRRMFGSNSTWLHASKTRAVLLLGLWPYGYRFHVSIEDRFQMYSSELKLLVKCSVLCSAA